MSDETPTPEATPEAPPAEAAPTSEQTVPYERFAAKIAEIKALESRLADAQALIEGAQALQTQLETMQNERAADAAKFQQTEALLRAGVLDEDIAELARWRFNKSESDNFAEWLATDAKNDAVLKLHLNAPTTEAAPPAAAPVQKPTPTPQPSPNTGARTAPPPRGEFSPEAVQNMSIEDLKRNYSKIAGAWGYTPHNFKS